MNSKSQSTIPYTELFNRHPSLKPLARDHGTGLVCVQRLQKAVSANKNERIQLSTKIQSICQQVIASYLQDEYKVLSTVVPADLIEGYSRRYSSLCLALDRMLLHEPGTEPGIELLTKVADAINDYVRWEERTLFPAIEEKCSEEELDQLKLKTASFDETHSRPMRKLHVSSAANMNIWLEDETLEKPTLDPEL